MAAAASFKEEVGRPFSDSGLMLMCETRLKLQSRMDNSSDTADSIWKRVQHVIALIDLRSLLASDLRFHRLAPDDALGHQGIILPIGNK